MHQEYHLSRSDSMKIIQVIADKQEKSGKGVAIAVVDDHGDLLAFLRTDGCGLPFIKVAINKAYTAARERNESKAVGEFAKGAGFPVSSLDDRYTAWGGGIPIFYQGQFVGAVGVSGLTEEEDTALSRLGVKILES